MLFTLLDGVLVRLASMLGQSGFVTSGHGMPHGEHEPFEIGIASLLGALGGFVAGLLLGRLVKFIAYLAGRELSTGRWAIYGAGVGAILAGLWETLGD